jgi:hypothetical protein
VALAQLNQQLQQQAASLAYFDLFCMFAVAVCVAPVVFLMRPAVAGKGEVHAH